MPRWNIHTLIYVAILMTWCAGDSLPEKFEAARAAYVVCHPKRKRPGKTCTGFATALGKLPMPVLRCLAGAVRGQIIKQFGKRLYYQGWIPLGCDGSRLETPRSKELEKRLGAATGKNTAPMLYVSSVVHLTLGFCWCWEWGKGGKSSERDHMKRMIKKLPKDALLVADAGYLGYDLMRALMKADVKFLIRMSSHATFYREEDQPLNQFREGRVWYWPKTICGFGAPPLSGRLIRVRKRRLKNDVWLFTNAPEEKLPQKLASRFYRWRWENEGFFRTYKRTLGKVKLATRTVRAVHREAEVSMLATQLLLCMGALAIPARKDARIPVLCSPREVLLAIRKEMARRRRFRKTFGHRIANAIRERRRRKTAKEAREWPARKKHTPPKPPKVLTLTDELNSLLQQYLQAEQH